MSRSADPKTLEVLVEDFLRLSAQRAADAEWWRADDLDFASACKRAARSITRDDNIHGHQRRPGHKRMAEFAMLVEDNASLLHVDDFEELLLRVTALARLKWRNPTLVAYDVADRVAYRLGIEPRFVYLHAGTREGAKLLTGSLYGKASIPVTDLPQPLHALTARQAEDFLCSYKKFFFWSAEESNAQFAGTLSSGGCGGRKGRGGC